MTRIKEFFTLIHGSAILFLLLAAPAVGQDGFAPALNSLGDLPADSLSKLFDLPGDSAKAVRQTAGDIIYWKEKGAFTGNASLGFHGTSTRDGEDNLYNIYGGVNMDWDFYPGKLNFNTLVGITFTDGELQQNVSKIDISYDHHHLHVGNGLVLENYLYLNRSTDAYLGIDQQYEIGGGIIVNNWIKRLNPPGDERFPIGPSGKDTGRHWDAWLRKVEPALTEKDLRAFDDQYKEARIKNRKANSRLRTALLIGVYFELQQTTVQDSISLPTTNHFRWVLRPTMDIALRDGWSMKIRPYIKLPMPWEWQASVRSPDGRVDRRTDYMVDMTVQLSTKLLSDRVRIGFIYSLVYDNSPPRTWYGTTDGSYTLVENNDLYQAYRMSLTVGLARD